jgi:hypothetical protein
MKPKRKMYSNKTHSRIVLDKGAQVNTITVAGIPQQYQTTELLCQELPTLLIESLHLCSCPVFIQPESMVL